ncbi:hypothetical protein [Novosphingobium sp. B 225]|uniref:hypothetical protein n=1 Tax=Novosphingobium sp. B 225 TaxID=1961849 RepID=UPI001124D7A1|nr:hypothetical protein [Novosphingobium sp. B 225]
MRAFALTVAGLALGLSALPAQAEVLQVFGLIPARNDEAAALRSIVVDGFGGSEGPALTIRIEDLLRGLSVDGTPWFRVLPAATASGGDALLRGTADAEVQFQRYTEKREECAEKDGDGKCLRKEQRQVKCSKRRITLDVAMRMVGPDGTLIFSDDTPETVEDSSCEGDENPPRNRNDVVRGLVGRVAERLRLEFSPRYTDAQVRVDENRKGLAKVDADRFKQAVRLTKSDPRAACQVWSQVGAGNPGHVPTQFNLALCAETRGAEGEQAAYAGYRKVLEMSPNYGAAIAGTGRIDRNLRARAQITAHNRG